MIGTKISATMYEHLPCARHSTKCRICINTLSRHGSSLYGTSSLVGEIDNRYILKIYDILIGIKAMKKLMVP